MPKPLTTPKFSLGALVLAFSFVNGGIALAQNTQPAQSYALVKPPLCTNNKGEKIAYVDRKSDGQGVAAGMAIRDKTGKPVIFRSNYTAALPQYQSFIDMHECAHHQTGDVDRPHPPRNGPEHLMNEAISDCVAILRLRDEKHYDKADVKKVTTAMRNEMSKIGFPEISISSRIRNIDNCYAKYGTPQEFISGVLKQRGLTAQ